MVLVGNGRPEQRHNAVAGELVDETLEALDAVGKDLEEALHDGAPLLGVELLGEVHRPLHVGEEHADLFAFAFENAFRFEDFFGEMLRSEVSLCEAIRYQTARR